MDEYVKKMSIRWLGHATRMHVDRRPKQALFGWWAGQRGKSRNTEGARGTTQARWLLNTIQQAGCTEMD
eukprot:4386047-Karenia_brevis.AAC.1